MKINNFIWFTGLWFYPPLALIFHYIIYESEINIPLHPILKIAFAYILPLIVPIIITVTNIERQQRGQTDFSFAATYGLAAKDERHSKAYLDAAYPTYQLSTPARYQQDLSWASTKVSMLIVPLIRMESTDLW